MKRLFVFAFIIGIALSLFAVDKDVAQAIKNFGLQPVKEGQEIIDFELEDLDGNKVSLSSFKGKVVLLNFWATWCPPCRSEIPSMQKLYDELKSLGFVIVAVDLREDKKTVKKFAKEYKMTFPILLDKTGQIGGMYGARSIPTSYLIDKNGYIIAGITGSIDWDTKEAKKLIKLLAGKIN